MPRHCLSHVQSARLQNSMLSQATMYHGLHHAHPSICCLHHIPCCRVDSKHSHIKHAHMAKAMLGQAEADEAASDRCHAGLKFLVAVGASGAGRH